MRCSPLGWMLLLIFASTLCLQQASAAAKYSARKSAGGFGGVVTREPMTNPVTQTQFSISGNGFYLIEKSNGRGKVTDQILISNDRTTISIDRNGDGYLDSWQLVTPGRTVTMREPTRGSFRIMDVEEIAEKVIVNMKFYLTSKGDYRLFAVKKSPNKTMFQGTQNGLIVGCRSSEIDLSILAAAVNEAVKINDKNLADVVRDKMLMPGCRAGEYTGKTDAMVAGIMDVFGSDPLWNKSLSKGMTSAASRGDGLQSVKKHGKFLQCLRYYQLDTHASRIEAAAASYFLDKSNSSYYTFEVDCTTIGASGADKSTDPGFVQKTCKDISPNVKETVQNECAAGAHHYGIAGKYDQGGGFRPPRISFVEDKSAGGPPKTRDDFARTFFHEMLHFSRITDEWAVDEIESCCSQTDENATECKNLEKRLLSKKYAQSFENLIINAMDPINPTSDAPDGARNYADFRNLLREAMGGERGDQITDDFFGQVGEKYAKFISEKEIDGRKCTLKPEDSNYQKCKAEFNKQISIVIEKYFGDSSNSQCRSATSFSMAATESRKVCGQIEGLMRNLTQLQPNVCTKNICPVGKSSASRGTNWLMFLNQQAQADDVSGKICGMCQATKETIDLGAIDQSDFQLGERNEAIAKDGTIKRSDPLVGAPGDAGNAGNIAKVDRKAGSSAHVGYEQKVGPRRPDYSGRSTDRAARITQDLYRENSVFGKKLSALTEKIVKPLISQAQAGVRESGVNGVKEVGKKAEVPSVSVPDPMRAPASLASAPLNAMYSAKGIEGSVNGKGASEKPSTLASASAFASIEKSSDQDGSSNGGAGGTGGLNGSGVDSGGAGSSSLLPSRSGASEKDHATPGDERAKSALLAYLQRPFNLVRPELERPSVINSLRRHLIQVVDDNGLVYGAGFPKQKLIYDQEKDRLILTSEKKN